MQLSLLDWQQPCRMIVFPVRARVGRIRQTAQSINSSRSDREAEHRWRQALGAVRRSLETAGVSEDDLRTHLAEFLAAVDAELMKTGSAWRLQTPATVGAGGTA